MAFHMWFSRCVIVKRDNKCPLSDKEIGANQLKICH